MRELKSADGNPFLACDIVALAGFMGSPKRRRFDVTVFSKLAQELNRVGAPEWRNFELPVRNLG